MLRLPKLTTPATAAAVAVPDNVPPPGLVPIATLTFPVKPDAVLPWASWAVTCTAGVMTEPAVVVVGSAEKTRCDAAPGVMLNAVRSEERRVGKEGRDGGSREGRKR